jgi:inhibitor of cysteine peptidase
MRAKKMLKAGYVVALLSALVLVIGCASSDGVDVEQSGEARDMPDMVVLSEADSGSQVKLSPGQTLEVTLESNPTTGYGWEVSEVDGAVLAQVGEAEFQQASTEGKELVGVGGTETFRFNAANGETTLSLVYRRSWEKGVEPAKTFVVQIVVQ